MKPGTIKMDRVTSQNVALLFPAYVACLIRARLVTVASAAAVPDSLTLTTHLWPQECRKRGVLIAQRSTSPPSVTVVYNQPASHHGDGLIGGADEVWWGRDLLNWPGCYLDNSIEMGFFPFSSILCPSRGLLANPLFFVIAVRGGFRNISSLPLARIYECRLLV